MNNPNNTKEGEGRDLFFWALVGLLVVLVGAGGVFLYTTLRDDVQPGVVVSEEDSKRFLDAQEIIEADDPSIEDIHKAIGLLDQLLEQAPGVAELHFFHARAQLIEYFKSTPPDQKRAKRAEIKRHLNYAIELDPGHGAALAILAYLEFYIEHDFVAASKNYQRAIAVEPNQYETHLQYAQLLLVMGNTKEALAQNHLAMTMGSDIDVSSAGVWLYILLGDFRSAELELSKLHSYDSRSLAYHKAAIQLYEAQGDEDKAIKAYINSFIREAYTTAELDQLKKAFTLGGIRALSLWLAEHNKNDRDIGQGTGAIAMARYYAGALKEEETLKYLDQAADEGGADLLWLQHDPKFGFLIGNPGFAKLIARARQLSSGD